MGKLDKLRASAARLVGKTTSPAMTAGQLLADLRSRGCWVSTEGGAVKVRGLLTAALRRRIQFYKDELVVLIMAERERDAAWDADAADVAMKEAFSRIDWHRKFSAKTDSHERVLDDLVGQCHTYLKAKDPLIFGMKHSIDKMVARWGQPPAEDFDANEALAWGLKTSREPSNAKASS